MKSIKKKIDYVALKKLIEEKRTAVGVIGLGYVGLPLALTFAKNGFSTTGIDIDESRVKRITRIA